MSDPRPAPIPTGPMGPNAPPPPPPPFRLVARPLKPRPPSKPPRKPINPKPIRGVLLDLLAYTLPALVLVAYIDHAAWMAWWI